MQPLTYENWQPRDTTPELRAAIYEGAVQELVEATPDGPLAETCAP